MTDVVLFEDWAPEDWIDPYPECNHCDGTGEADSGAPMEMGGGFYTIRCLCTYKSLREQVAPETGAEG